MTSYKQVDAHFHIWDLQRDAYGDAFPPPNTSIFRSFSIADFCSELRQASSVRACVLVQVVHSTEETEWFLRELDSASDIDGGVVGWVDLTSSQVGEILDKLCQHPKLVGIRHITHDEPDVNWLLREDVHRGLAILEERNIPFDLLLKPPHLKHVPVLAKKFPRLRMVIDHISKPLIKDGVMDPWKADIEAAAQFPNIYCKISGMVTEADWKTWKSSDLQPYVKHVLSIFGAKRCMYGSDWPVCLLAADSYAKVYDSYVECVKACGCSDDDVRAIFRETAVEFYKLNV